MRDNFVMVIGIVFLIIVAILIFVCLRDIKTSDRIQAGSIVALVLVTIYYAIQTHKLVEEGKKKRDVDFWERTINEFYGPLIEKLNDIRTALHKDPIDSDNMNALRDEARRLLWNKGYMTFKKTIKEFKNLEITIFQTEIDHDRKSYKRFYEEEEKVRIIIVKEWEELEDKIRSFYGVQELINEDLNK